MSYFYLMVSYISLFWLGYASRDVEIKELKNQVRKLKGLPRTGPYAS